MVPEAGQARVNTGKNKRIPRLTSRNPALDPGGVTEGVGRLSKAARLCPGDPEEVVTVRQRTLEADDGRVRIGQLLSDRRPRSRAAAASGGLPIRPSTNPMLLCARARF